MTLVLLLDRCPDQLAADMRREYGLGMHDLDPSETAALAANLPAGSLVWQTLDTPRAWTFDQYLANPTPRRKQPARPRKPDQRTPNPMATPSVARAPSRPWA